MLYEDVKGKDFSGGYTASFNTIIPKGTECRVNIDSAEWKTDDEYYADEGYIKVSLRVLEPSEYRDVKINHKLKIVDVKNTTRINAQSMLKTYDTILNGEPKFASVEDVESMQGIVKVVVDVYKFTNDRGETIEGNYVVAVKKDSSPKAKDVDVDDLPF